MKSKDYLVKKYSYYNGNPDYLEEFSPWHGYYRPGFAEPEALDKFNYSDYFSDKNRSGSSYDDELKRLKKKRLKKLKKLKLLKKLKEMGVDKLPSKKDVYEPHPFYESMYGYTGFEGAYDDANSPLEWYSGSIADGPGAQTINPYNSTWQLASDNSMKIIIRSMILKDFYKKGS